MELHKWASIEIWILLNDGGPLFVGRKNTFMSYFPSYKQANEEVDDAEHQVESGQYELDRNV